MMMGNRSDTETQRQPRRVNRYELFSGFLCASVSLWLITFSATAAEPTVRDVSVRGLQVNGTTTLTITGDDLGKTPRLMLPFPSKQTLKPGGTDKKAEFEVVLGDVTPGLHQLRLVTEGGVSLPVVFGVDALPQKPFAPKIEALPAALHGTLAGATVLEASFAGKAGQKVTIEVEAQRVGGKLRPVLHLYNERKLQLAWTWGTPALDGDARLTATLPADGAYTIVLHDAEYAGQAPGHFRLKVGAFDFVDQVFPPVVTKETKSVELLGSMAAKVVLPAARGAVVPLDWPKGGTWTGPRPFVETSSRPEFLSPGTPGKPLDLPAGRVGVCGKLSSPGAEETFRVQVEPKTKVRFEVFAERLGATLDAALIVRNVAGAALAQAEDSPGTLDPVLEFTVPDKVTSVIVAVTDAQGRGGPRGTYRLTIDPVKGEGLGDYRLTTPLQRLSLTADGRAIVPVFAERRGYAGPIELTADGLPAGVKLEGTTIPPDADGTLVVVTATAEIPPAIIKWKARGPEGHDLLIKNHPLERIQPWLAAEFALAPAGTRSAAYALVGAGALAPDFAIDWKNLPADAGLSPGGKLALPVKVTRTEMSFPVRLTLLTTQAPPLVNNQPDLNRAIRLEKPTEFGAKVGEGDVPLLIPPDLPADAYQVAVLAELLTADKQRVQASAFTPVRTLKVKLPALVKFAAPSFDAPLDAKANATVEVKGTVERLNGFAGEVAVTLARLPAGVPVPGPINVKANESAFSFKLTLPPATPAGEAHLKLTATAADPKQPNVRVKLRDAAALLKVLPPKK
jgi:hypothetical protein